VFCGRKARSGTVKMLRAMMNCSLLLRRARFVEPILPSDFFDVSKEAKIA
jgi:hypothetical protein